MERELLRSGKIAVDTTLCSGCKTCEYVCSLSHEGVANPDLSRIRVYQDVLDGYYSEPQPCMQCEAAPCLAACKKGAIYTDSDTGAKVINEEKCVGCGLCVKACPATPKRVNLHISRKKAFKCDLCGGNPRCVSYCPMGAISYKEAKWRCAK